MDITISIYREWLERFNKSEEQRTLATAALDAFERINSLENVRPEDLASIVVAATNRHLAVWDIGTDLLHDLATRFPEAQDAMRNIMRSRKVNERFQVIASLSHGLSDSFAAEIIQLALQDKGYRVREKAAEAADRLKRRDLLPYLDDQLTVERDPRVRRSLTFHIAMLREGYLVEVQDDRAHLTWRSPRGWTSKILQPQDLSDDRIAAILEQELTRQHRIYGSDEKEITS